MGRRSAQSVRREVARNGHGISGSSGGLQWIDVSIVLASPGGSFIPAGVVTTHQMSGSLQRLVPDVRGP